MINSNYKPFLKSQEVLAKNYIADYPVNIKKLINNYGIMLATISEYEHFRAITNSTRAPISIKDGRAIYDPNRELYLIIYDDTKYNDRVRFTLAHELGHIILGHLNDIRTEMDRGGVPNLLYNKFEDEADTFAGTLLAPPAIVWAKYPFLDADHALGVQRSFGLSSPAVKFYRIPDCLYWKKNCVCTKIEKNVLNNYLSRRYAKYCDICNTQVFGKEYHFCHICGNRFSNKKGDIYMIYDKIPTSECGKALMCPVCGNEEIEEGDFCHICGKHIVNQCNHQKEDGYGNYLYSSPCCDATNGLPGNARYCPRCGSTTTFLDYKFLKKWDYNGTDDETNYEVVEGEDDDLPF